MASTGIKEYTLKINGITKNIEDVTKLEKVVKSLDAAVSKANANDAKGATTSRAKKAALTDEEKALQRLAAAEARLANITSETNRAQTAANIAIRERQRELTRSIKIEGMAEGSLAAMGMTLTDLRLEYEALSEAERNNIETGGQLLTKIQALDAVYKEARESTGNFRDSVGNYEKAGKGLAQLSQGLQDTGSSALKLASGLTGSNDVLGLFGNNADDASGSAEALNKIIITGTAAQELYTAVTKDSTLRQGAAAVMDVVRAAQLRAKTIAEAAATRGTVAATVVQKIFNVVAAANPYVLLALALVTVVGALLLFSSGTDKATESQQKLNEESEAFLGFLDAEAAALKLVSDARVSAAERAIKILKNQEGKTKDIRKLEDEIAKEKAMNNARQRGLYFRELQDLEANRSKLAEYNELLLRIKNAQARGDNKVMLDVDLNGNARKVKVEDALDIVQKKMDGLGKKIEIAVKLKTEDLDLRADEDAAKFARLKEDREAAKAAAEKAKKAADEAKARKDKAAQDAKDRANLAKEIADLEYEAIRTSEDAKLKLLDNGYATARKKVEVEYSNQIKELQKRLKTETKLSTTARAAINSTIVTLEKIKNKELAALKNEYDAQALEDTRALEDQRTALMLGIADRAEVEIKARYDRQIEDLKTRLEIEKGLTEDQVKALNEMVVNAEALKQKELTALTADGLKKRSDQLINGLEADLTLAQEKLGDFVARNKDGLELIDVEKTRANLASANDALGIYIAGLREYLVELEKTHTATLATLKEGSVEYQDELNRYAQATEGALIKITKAEKTQAENTKLSTQASGEYYKDLFGKIAEMAGVISDVVGQAMDTFNMALAAQIEELTAALDTINEKYDAAKKNREDAVKNVEDVEKRFQDAGAGTSDALKSQLADAMAARNEYAREEKRLAKEKEKLEAEIAKKEKQQKKNDLISSIAGGIANTAQGITQALTLPFPFNFVVAGLVGAMGAAQVAIMGRQLTKLEDGGLIKGPSHAQGGIRIPGTDVEIEGREYVVNKETTDNNLDFIGWLNSQRKRVTMDDISGFFNKPVANTSGVKTFLADGGQLPNFNARATPGIDYDRLADAMGSIKIEPKVAVTDIMDAADQVTTVREISGF